MKKKIIRYTFLFIMLILSLVALNCCSEEPVIIKDNQIRVSLMECDGLNILSDSVVDVKSGKDVSFEVEIDEDYVYLGNTANAYFDEKRGKLTVSNNKYPTTIELILVPKSELIHLEFSYNALVGSVYAEEGEEWMTEPGQVKLVAEAYKGYKFDGWSKNGYLSDGGVKVSNDTDYTFQIESNVKLYANFVKVKTYYLNYQSNRGKVNVVSETNTEPKRVTVAATPSSGYAFDGWSKGGYLSEGGTLVSDELSYTFNVKDDVVLYANFNSNTGYVIVYNTNGGTVSKTGKTTYQVRGEYKELFPMQQTLQSNDTFVRSGYIPVGYSTQPCSYDSYTTVNNIPGFSNMGGVCDVGETGTLQLYVVWAKETTASNFTFSGGKIIKYNGSSKIVVIPETINGVAVTSIEETAFTNNTVIERVVIPKTVTNVSKNAFKGCTKLREVVFFDSLQTVYDASFSGCTKLSTVVINAKGLPRYSGTAEGTFCIKYERLRMLKGKKLIVVSGSSTLNGLNSPVFESNFPGYSVINYGTNGGNTATFFLEVVAKYTGQGDIIIHAPEWTTAPSMGATAFNWKLFREHDQCYDIFREVNMTRYTAFWESWRSFQQQSASMAGKQYQLTSYLNYYGDLTNNRSGGPQKDKFQDPTQTFNEILSYQNLNDMNELIKAKGGTLLMSFCTFDKSCMAPSCVNQTAYDNFTEYCQSKLNYPVISNVGTYIMEHKYFFDSQYHCNFTGRDIRTENLTADLRKYLASVK